MRTPSAKALSAVFSDPKTAKRILQMPRAQLCKLPAGRARVANCYNPPETENIRLHCLNAIESGLYGVEWCQTTRGQYVDYLNAGDVYTPTLIYWRGTYRVQSLGDFIESLGRQSVRFIRAERYA